MTFENQIKRELTVARKAIAAPDKQTLSYLAVCKHFLRTHAGWK